MPDIVGVIRSNLAYSNFALAAVWAVVAVFVGSALVAWPVFLFVVSGALLLFRPVDRVTWAWSLATVFSGLVLSGYQAYSALAMIGTVFASAAASSFAVFVVFTVVQALVLYSSGAPKSA